MTKPSPPNALPWWYPAEQDVHDVSTLAGLNRAWLQGGSVKILLVQLTVAAAIRPFLGPPGLVDLAILGAIALYWPFQEWFAHVFLLHARPRTVRLPLVGEITLDPFAAKAHRFHHQQPWLLHPIFVPWPVIAVLVPLHFAAWWLIAPTPALAFTGILGFTLATLAYEWLHLLAHVKWVPSSPYLRQVQAHHRAHHFRNEQHWFAFSVPPIDDLLGTGGTPRDVPKSDTTHTLGIP